MMFFLVCSLLIMFCFSKVGKFLIAKLLQGFLMFIASFGIFIWAGLLMYWKAQS